MVKENMVFYIKGGTQAKRWNSGYKHLKAGF